MKNKCLIVIILALLPFMSNGARTNIDPQIINLGEYGDFYLHDQPSAPIIKKRIPSNKITIEQIEQGKLLNPKYVKHLELTREKTEHLLRSDHIRTLVHLYPNIEELTLTNLGITKNKASEIASHFHRLKTDVNIK